MQEQKPIQPDNEPIPVPKPHFDYFTRHLFIKRRMLFLMSGLAIGLIILIMIAKNFIFFKKSSDQTVSPSANSVSPTSTKLSQVQPAPAQLPPSSTLEGAKARILSRSKIKFPETKSAAAANKSDLPTELQIFILDGAGGTSVQKIYYQNEVSGYLITYQTLSAIAELNQKYNFMLFKASWSRLFASYNDLFSLIEAENSGYQTQIIQEKTADAHTDVSIKLIAKP